MSTAISSDQFYEDISSLTKAARSFMDLPEKNQIKLLKEKASNLRIFNHKTEYLKNLNQMITTDWIPEFYIGKSNASMILPYAKL